MIILMCIIINEMILLLMKSNMCNINMCININIIINNMCEICNV